MYCSRCGKKVTDAMLFCPFCGEPIVIPDQDEPQDQAPQVDAPAVEAEPARKPSAPSETPIPEMPQVSLRKVDDAEAELLDWSQARRQYVTDDPWSADRAPREAFAPLKLEEEAPPDESWREDIARRKQEAAPEKKAPDMRVGESEPVRLDGVAPKLEADIEGAKDVGGTHKKPRNGASTLVPPKQMDPDDIFMDGGDAPNDFDDRDRRGRKRDDSGNDFMYEEADERTFFMRHIRGFVGLTLFVILLLLFVIYAFSPAGQQSLARLNLAWQKDAYTNLGYEYYQQEQYAQAGLYYERALQRDPENYSYASSAAMAYVQAGETAKATAMLKRCAEISPTLLEPYIYLLNLYPDAAQRPWDVTQLLQQGYERTGDARLNVTG